MMIKSLRKVSPNLVGKNKARAILRGCRLILAAIFVWSAAVQAEESVVTQKATFAAGCFWGVEKVFAAIPGVTATQVGYTGGHTKYPTYEEVCTGRTGHAEAIEITYDPSKVSYDELLEQFFRHHDPTTRDRQGNDIGDQYRSAVFYHTQEEEKKARAAIRLLSKAKIFKAKIVTRLEPAHEFYPAEEYHQMYLKKNPHGYCHLQLQSAKIGEILRKARS